MYSKTRKVYHLQTTHITLQVFWSHTISLCEEQSKN